MFQSPPWPASQPSPLPEIAPPEAQARGPAEVLERVTRLQESERLHALHSLGLLDTLPEPEYDDIVRLAAMICNSPVGLVQLVDAHRQWSKSVFGEFEGETPREVAFCHYAIKQPDLMLVEDATLDHRFCNSPLVRQAGWRFYAGAPIRTPDGYAVGTLCVLDRTPRRLTQDQCMALEVLAGQVNARLALRLQQQAVANALAAAEAARYRAEALELRFHAFMDSGPFLAFIKDPEGRMLYYNEGLARTFAVDRQQLLNKTDHELWPQELADTYRNNDLEVLATGKLAIRDEATRGQDGATSIWRSYKFPCTDADGRQLLGGISLDMTAQLWREEQLRQSQAELENANQLLRELASVDPLTGLVNRRSFDESLRTSYRQSRGKATPVSVLMLDVDHFKQHNDRFGHSHGDDVLKELASCLRSTLRAGDVVARYGGEEFMILMPEARLEQAIALGNRILSLVRSREWMKAPVTVSIGLSTSQSGVGNARDLVDQADKALYEAKCLGRDRLAIFHHSPSADASGELASVAPTQGKGS